VIWKKPIPDPGLKKSTGSGTATLLYGMGKLKHFKSGKA
jgi:hypothetical protein